MPAIVFFGIATSLALLHRGVGELRLRAAARRVDPAADPLCALRQQNRITTGLGAAAGVGLVVAVLAEVAAVF